MELNVSWSGSRGTSCISYFVHVFTFQVTIYYIHIPWEVYPYAATCTHVAAQVALFSFTCWEYSLTKLQHSSNICSGCSYTRCLAPQNFERLQVQNYTDGCHLWTDTSTSRRRGESHSFHQTHFLHSFCLVFFFSSENVPTSLPVGAGRITLPRDLPNQRSPLWQVLVPHGLLQLIRNKAGRVGEWFLQREGLGQVHVIDAFVKPANVLSHFWLCSIIRTQLRGKSG